MKVKFKKLHDDAILPKYAKEGDAGLDCWTVSDAEVTDTYVKYDLGFSVEIPEGYVGLIFPRSSISKTDYVLANSVGVIDSGYRGEVQARFKATNYRPTQYRMEARSNKIYKKGDRVCQLVIIPIPDISPEWSDTLSDTSRGEGGFGHTGQK